MALKSVERRVDELELNKQDTLVSGVTIKTINGNSVLGSGNLTVGGSVAWGNITGTLSDQTDLQTALNAKQNTLISGTNIKTINGNTLLGSGDLTISTGITVGTTPVTSGTDGRVFFQSGGVVQQDSNFFWDNTNKRLGVGTNAPDRTFDVNGIARIRGALTVSVSNLPVINLFDTLQNHTWQFRSNGKTLWFIADGQNRVVYTDTGSVGVGTISPQARLDVRAQGALSTDIAFRVRNSADTINLFQVNGNGELVFNNLTTLNISTATQANSRVVVFNTNGSSGGFNGGYDFKAGWNNSNGDTALRIWNSSVGSRVGIGNLTEANLQGGATNLYIRNTITGGRNSGIRISPSATSTSQFNGVQFDFGNLDSNGGAFIGQQYNPLTNGYSSDFVILLSQETGNSYVENIRFVGKHNMVLIGTDKTAVNASAKLQVDSTTKGFLPPRMTTTQRTAIATPAAGLIVYDTTDNKHYGYDGTAWNAFY